MAEHERSWRALREHWQKYERERVHASEDFRRKKGLWERAVGFLKRIFGRE